MEGPGSGQAGGMCSAGGGSGSVGKGQGMEGDRGEKVLGKWEAAKEGIGSRQQGKGKGEGQKGQQLGVKAVAGSEGVVVAAGAVAKVGWERVWQRQGKG